VIYCYFDPGVEGLHARPAMRSLNHAYRKWVHTSIVRIKSSSDMGSPVILFGPLWAVKGTIIGVAREVIEHEK
jgi:hypothetical protein